MTVAEPTRVAPDRSDAEGTRLPSLTGLRFAGAFLVFGFHVHIGEFIAGGPVRNAMQWVFGPGAGGVSFFFVLSGFVLTWSARPYHTAGRFWRRRFAKIYPNHLVTALAAAGMTAAVAGASLSVAVVIPNLLLVHGWWPDPRVFFGLNTVSWSLACEAFFYALFPVLYHVARRLPAGSLWPATITVFAIVWLIPVAAQLLPDGYRYWAIWVFPVARLPEFIAGILLARIVMAGRWPATPLWPVVVVAAAAYTCSRWLPEDFRLVAATSAPLALLVAGFGAADAAGRLTAWGSRAAIWLGELSYAFYLVHLLTLRLLARVFGVGHPAVAGLAEAVAALILAVLCSRLLYRCVERPAMRVIGGSGRRAPDRTGRAPAATR